MSVASDSDDESGTGNNVDEYGERFEDYGFLRRAEDHKMVGNAEFKSQRYEKALKEYDAALDSLLTVAYDKSIIIGNKKWNDVVILRSTLCLNKSTCYFKLRSWTEAVDSAQECLIGNPRDQMMYTDPRIRAKIKEAQKEQGFSGMTLLEDRLPRTLRAKAWFRLSQCYTNQGYSERAREAAAKARDFCDDSEMSAELTRHSRQIGALEGSQRSRQKKQFRGFFQKLQDRGGYLDEAAQRKVRLEGLTYQQKLRYLEQLDDSDDDEDLRLPVLEDDYSAGRDLDGENSRELSSVKAPDVQTTSNLRAPEADPVTKEIPYCGNDILPQRSEELDCIEAKWRARQRQELVDEAEDEELRRAKERLAAKQQQQQQQVRSH